MHCNNFSRRTVLSTALHRRRERNLAKHRRLAQRVHQVVDIFLALLAGSSKEGQGAVDHVFHCLSRPAEPQVVVAFLASQHVREQRRRECHRSRPCTHLQHDRNLVAKVIEPLFFGVFRQHGRGVAAHHLELRGVAAPAHGHENEHLERGEASSGRKPFCSTRREAAEAPGKATNHVP